MYEGDIRETETASQAPALQPEAPAPLPLLPGLEVERAVDRLAGNRRLYAKTLRMLLELGPKHADELARGLETRDWPGVRRAVHTLKGMAGTVGAAPLQEEAASLEQILDDQPEQWDEIGQAAARFRTSLDALLCMIASAVPCEATRPDGPKAAMQTPQREPGNEASAGRLLSFFITLLLKHDASAPLFFADNHRYLASLLPEGSVPELKAHLDNGNYDAALAIARRPPGAAS